MRNLSKRIERLEFGGNRGECVVCQIGRELSGMAAIECKHRPGYSYADAIRELDEHIQEDDLEHQA